MRTSTNFFLFSLAVADIAILLMGSLSHPKFIQQVKYLHIREKRIYPSWLKSYFCLKTFINSSIYGPILIKGLISSTLGLSSHLLSLITQHHYILHAPTNQYINQDHWKNPLIKSTSVELMWPFCASTSEHRLQLFIQFLAKLALL